MPTHRSKSQNYEVVYTWSEQTDDDGNIIRADRQKIRYRRPVTDLSLALEVRELRRRARRGGYASPYSLRRIA